MFEQGQWVFWMLSDEFWNAKVAEKT